MVQNERYKRQGFFETLGILSPEQNGVLSLHPLHSLPRCRPSGRFFCARGAGLGPRAGYLSKPACQKTRRPCEEYSHFAGRWGSLKARPAMAAGPAVRLLGGYMKNTLRALVCLFCLWAPAVLAQETPPPTSAAAATGPDPKLLEKALKGDAEAQYALATAYGKGEDGAPRDHKAALTWFLKAANQNHTEAQYDLGMFYMFSEETGARSASEGVKWFRRAAERGHVGAQNAVAAAYASGEGVDKNYQEAMKWWRKAADKNSAEAEFNIGYSYLMGEGVDENDAEAFKWITLSAQQNFTEAQYMLGRLYLEGIGTAADLPLSVKWFHEAAKKRHAGATMMIGDAYIEGRGVPQNRTEAFYWYSLAAEIDETYKAEKDELRETISPRDQVEVQKRLMNR